MLALLVMAIGATNAAAAPPNGNFTIAPNPPNQGKVATFTCQPCPSSSSVTVTWDITGGTFFERSGRTVTHTYLTAGSQTVRMRLSHPQDGSRIITKTFTVNGWPAVDFDYEPVSPFPGEDVQFAAEVTDPEGDAIATQAWTFGDGESGSGAAPVHSYDNPGTYTVSLTATDARGASQTQSRQIVVREDPGPTASFDFTPTVPVTGESAMFQSTSQPSTGAITELRWDLDDDGEFDDAQGSKVSWSFASGGTHEVWLLVSQTNGKQAVARETLRVNSAPSAGFTWNPFSPVTGQWVDLASTSSDVEGALADQSWDLDGDGNFGDASGPSARYPYPRPGAYDVGLRVTDSEGVVRTIRRQLFVLAPAAASGPAITPIVPPAGGAPRPRPARLMTPFPIVRIAGTVLPSGAAIRILSVRGPRGAQIRVRCTGRGCPVGAVARTSATRIVRFRQFERRLRAGIRLELFVRQQGRIGKYTRFLIRAGEAPKRVDLCLFPTRRSPARCP